MEDNPRKDLDATGENGIENIEVPRIDPIVYDVFVEYWGMGIPATAAMVINVGGQTTRATSPVVRPRDVRWVARVDGRAGTVAPQGIVTDCSADWTGDCRLPLP